FSRIYLSSPYLFLPSYTVPAHRHSSPTRRSSDLVIRLLDRRVTGEERFTLVLQILVHAVVVKARLLTHQFAVEQARHRTAITARSEEHTSELQSREKLVCRLLLEKKKK